MSSTQSILKHKIQSYITTHKLSVAGFERDTGLKTNVVRNILRGQSKHPTAETLQGIAKGIGCTLQELLDEKQESSGSPSTLEHPDLLIKALQATLKVAQKQGLSLKIKQAFAIAEQVYGFSLKKSPPTIDENFVEWLFEQI